MPSLADTATFVDAEFARIVDELTRRGFLGGLAGAAGLLGLAACRSDGARTDGRSTGARSATRQVSSVHGPITVPADPKRVVTLDGFSMAAMFDLGLNPVGVYSAATTPWREGQFWLYGPGSPIGGILADAGCASPPAPPGSTPPAGSSRSPTN